MQFFLAELALASDSKTPKKTKIAEIWIPFGEFLELFCRKTMKNVIITNIYRKIRLWNGTKNDSSCGFKKTVPFSAILAKSHRRVPFFKSLFSNEILQLIKNNLTLKYGKNLHNQQWVKWTKFVSVHLSESASSQRTKLVNHNALSLSGFGRLASETQKRNGTPENWQPERSQSFDKLKKK